jgi:hypothetical protein
VCNKSGKHIQVEIEDAGLLENYIKETAYIIWNGIAYTPVIKVINK